MQTFSADRHEKKIAQRSNAGSPVWKARESLGDERINQATVRRNPNHACAAWPETLREMPDCDDAPSGSEYTPSWFRYRPRRCSMRRSRPAIQMDAVSDTL